MEGEDGGGEGWKMEGGVWKSKEAIYHTAGSHDNPSIQLQLNDYDS